MTSKGWLQVGAVRNAVHPWVFVLGIASLSGCRDTYYLDLAEDNIPSTDNSTEPTAPDDSTDDNSGDDDEESTTGEEKSETGTPSDETTDSTSDPDPTTSSDLPTDETTTEDPIEPSPCEAALLWTMPEALGIQMQYGPPWESGVCIDINITNLTNENIFWAIALRFGGHYSNSWNSEATQINDRDWQFGGDPGSNNAHLLIGESTTIGVCMSCDPNGSDDSSDSDTSNEDDDTSSP